MKFKKLLCVISSLLFLFCATACNSEKPITENESAIPKDTAYTDNMEGVFDDSNIVLTAPMLSDTHLEGGWAYESSYKKFLKAVEIATNASVTKKADLVCVAGDLVCCTNSPNNVYHSSEKYPGTYEEEYAKQSKLEKENLLRAIVDSIYPSTKFFYCPGNHDSNNNEHTQDFITALSGSNNEYYNYFYGDDLDKAAMLNGNRHIKVNGYNFLALTHGPKDADYNWLKNKLDEITKAEPNKTVFLLNHFKPANMTYASSGHSKELREFLKDYPQVIIFGGHAHAYVDFENAIMQNESGFISVDCGALQDNAWENVINQSKAVGINYNEKELLNRYTGLLMEVDNKGNVRISRFDFGKNAKVGNNWIIPAVKSDGTRELLYTDDRAEKVENPIFSTNNLTAEYSMGKINVSIPKAYSPANIWRYEVTVTDNSGNTSKIAYLSSLFFKYPSYSDAPDFYTGSFKPSISISSGQQYTVTAVALDCWGNKSEPLTFNLTV